MTPISVPTRLLFSLFSNALRAILTFATGVLIARELGPSKYGEVTFLLGSFVAIRTLLDMGSSSAFYTFISRQSRSNRFFKYYFIWLGLQFSISLTLVYLIIPSDLFDEIWLGQFRGTVALAFVAVFVQQQIWPTVVQIGESARSTIRVQQLNIAVAFVYLIVVCFQFWLSLITVQNVLWILISVYGIAAIFGLRLLRVKDSDCIKESDTLKKILREYWIYCKPMLGLAVTGCLYAFADKWMLQKFGGSAQQGFFQVASQFAQVSLIATVSVLNIFWKEIAEARNGGDHERVALLYKKINRGLVILSATIAGLLFPWAEQIVAILLGPTYADAWPVLAIMFLYPIHQSMGQIGATMFMATGDTRKYVMLSVSLMLVTLPISYFVLAPSAGMLLPGLGLGAIGMATYLVVTGVAAVNIQAWMIARHNGWKFDWIYQVVGIPLMICLGYASKLLVGLVWELNTASTYELLVPVAVMCVLYALAVALSGWTLPRLFGMEKEDLYYLVKILSRRA